MKTGRFVFLSGLLVLVVSCRTAESPTADLIPVPAEVETGAGSFDLRRGVAIGCADSLLLPVSEDLAAVFAELQVPCDGTTAAENASVTLEIDSKLAPQAYNLSVTSRRIALRGGSYEGVVSAAATLQQLLWRHPDRLRVMEINDAPRFGWRGVMLDVARHFFTPSEIRMLIDRMALYKFNRLHLHLTDDQGWRLEIKRYPELTERGAWRRLNRHDSLCMQRAETDRDPKYRLPADRLRECDGELSYGGFYTQDQIRDLIAYAARHGIEVVPEIDLPGHSLATIGCFPWLSCTGRGGWGKDFSTPLCLGRDSTLEFCRNVLSEVFDLFPSTWVHVGGDEVDPAAWQTCPHCLRRVETEHLDGIKELQAWFTRELERFCRMHGKTMIGWDEIVDDGIALSTTVMWWRSWLPNSLNGALQQGHRVILSPAEYLYLSPKQDRNSLAKVYGWEPVPGNLPARGTQLEGLQCHLWSEQAPSWEVVGERIFPRMLAVSEIAWSRSEDRDFADFERRLPLHLQQLDEHGWNYRLNDVDGVCDRNVFVGRTEVALSVPAGATLRYTFDVSVPDTSSLCYSKPFTIDRDTTLVLRCFNRSGIGSAARRVRFSATDYAPAQSAGGNLAPGLLVRWYDFDGERCGDIDEALLKDNYVSRKIGIPEEVVGDIGLIFDGYIVIPADGIYSFYTYSDDGSVLEIDGCPVVENDGPHSRLERSGQAALRKGLHKFSLRYFDTDGGILEAGMISTDGKHIPFHDDMFRH